MKYYKHVDTGHTDSYDFWLTYAEAQIPPLSTKFTARGHLQAMIDTRELLPTQAPQATIECDVTRMKAKWELEDLPWYRFIRRSQLNKIIGDNA